MNLENAYQEILEQSTPSRWVMMDDDQRSYLLLQIKSVLLRFTLNHKRRSLMINRLVELQGIEEEKSWQRAIAILIYQLQTQL